mmetsp:Transcript_3442/g.12367  ORF Transcript_3442/g.12367 Transcript_3442/m.12367 type:complete len:80 (+) Transcript_3442:568-807(+)
MSDEEREAVAARARALRALEADETLRAALSEAEPPSPSPSAAALDAKKRRRLSDHLRTALALLSSASGDDPERGLVGGE